MCKRFLCIAVLTSCCEILAGTNVVGVVHDAVGYNAWPMVQAIGKRLVCAYSRGSAHSIGEGARGVWAKVSDDGGVSWSDERPVVNDPRWGEVTTGKGLDDAGAMLLWIRCWSGDEKHHDLYRTVDGGTFEKIATPKLEPVPMQITDIFHVPGRGLMSLWFSAGYDYLAGADGKSWGTLVSPDGGKTWERFTAESNLKLEDWPTEPSGVYLGDGRILVVARSEAGTRHQFQMVSEDNGRTWRKFRTNITDVCESTPSLVLDANGGRIFNYYYQRGAKELKCRTARVEDVLKNPRAWPDPTVLFRGHEERAFDAGNVNVTRIGDTHYAATYTGTAADTAVVVVEASHGATDSAKCDEQNNMVLKSAEAVGKSVWPKGLEAEMNTLVAFRADFKAKASDEVCLDLVAWYSYRVSLNGRFVAFGPARGPKGYFRPDELKLPVCDGENHLQIEVAGYNVPNFYLMEQPPFFKATVRVDGDVAAVSHRDFRAWRLPRVQKAPRYSFQRTFAEIYDVPGAEIGPLELVAAPEPKLIKRVVPYPDYEVRAPIPISFADVSVDLSRKTHADRSLALPGQPGSGFKGFRMEELTLNSAYLAQRLAYANRREATPEERAAESFELTAGRSVVFDNGLNDTGFPEFSVTVKKPGRIALTFDEVLTDGEVRGVDRYRDCCNVIVWNLESPGTYRLSSFEPYTMRYFDLGLLEGEAKVTDVRFRSYKNATAKVAKFRASDPVLARIFEAAKETFRQNAVDVFMDCPSRERAGWNCDAYFTAPASTLLTGNADLERVFEECIALPASFDNLPDGMIPMCYPSDHTSGNFIPNWAMWFVLETEEYLARSGDREMVDRLRPRLEKLVSYLWTFRNSDGLLERLPKWVFVEWSRSNKLVQDVNYPSNMTWAEVLEAMARLYGRTELAQEAERVRETVRRQSWTGKWFCDNAVRQADGSLKLSGECTETCQYYAFFFGTATKERYPELWLTLLADFGPQRFSEDRKTLKSHPDIWPSNAFIGNYLRLKLLEREGLGNRILSETKGYFQYMADRTGTLWENDTTCASCNHGFASYAAVLLVRAVLGVEKIDLVNRTVTIRDTDVDLDFCEAELPTPDGMLSVGWRKVGGEKKRKASVPEGWRVKEVSK